jgi:bifunctional N-acetylglucosamine-1-phosphate-uridyltransferase/glucosamine-1-phosphate-acetyltransferase GlmU-like protein
VAGVNDKVQLAELERVLQQNQAHQFMQQGLMLKDPARFDCRGTLGGFFYLNKVANLGAFTNISVRADACKWPDRCPIANDGIFNN